MNEGASYRGHILVAAPELVDPNFHRTVVLIVEDDEQGTLGLVLNRPSQTTVKELWAELDDLSCDSEQPLFFGGPVQGPLMGLHIYESLADSAVLPGVFFSVQKDHLTELVNKEPHSYRLFVGHAGWSPGQLEAEMEQGSWLSLPATPELVFESGEDLWDKVRAEFVQSSLMKGLKIRHAPPDPRMN